MGPWSVAARNCGYEDGPFDEDQVDRFICRRFFVEVSVEEIDRDFAVLASLCESSEAAEEQQLEQALQ